MRGNILWTDGKKQNSITEEKRDRDFLEHCWPALHFQVVESP